MKIVTIILPWTLIRPNIIQASTEASKCSFLANIFSPRDKRRFYYWYDLHACATEGTKFLVKSVCEKAPCSWLPPVDEDLSCTMTGLLTKLLSICQSGWQEIRNGFPVMRWVGRGAQNKNIAVISQTLLTRLDYTEWRWCELRKYKFI